MDNYLNNLLIMLKDAAIGMIVCPALVGALAFIMWSVAMLIRFCDDIYRKTENKKIACIVGCVIFMAGILLVIAIIAAILTHSGVILSI